MSYNRVFLLLFLNFYLGVFCQKKSFENFKYRLPENIVIDVPFVLEFLNESSGFQLVDSKPILGLKFVGRSLSSQCTSKDSISKTIHKRSISYISDSLGFIKIPKFKIYNDKDTIYTEPKTIKVISRKAYKKGFYDKNSGLVSFPLYEDVNEAVDFIVKPEFKKTIFTLKEPVEFYVYLKTSFSNKYDFKSINNFSINGEEIKVRELILNNLFFFGKGVNPLFKISDFVDDISDEAHHKYYEINTINYFNSKVFKCSINPKVAKKYSISDAEILVEFEGGSKDEVSKGVFILKIPKIKFEVIDK